MAQGHDIRARKKRERRAARKGTKQRGAVGRLAGATNGPVIQELGPQYHVSVQASELAPPGISGDLQTVFHYDPPSSQTDDERLGDPEERDFDVHAVLMRDSGFERDIKTDLGPADGTSFFQVPAGVDRLFIENSSGKFAFVLNEKREYSGIQARCRARSAAEARAIVLRAVSPVIDHLAYFANAPLIVGNILCVDRKNNVSIVGYTSPYRTLVVSPGHMSFPFDLLPIYALYREAKNATSHFYRFLCYYKILEGIYSTLRKQLFESARKLGIPIVTQKEVIPEHPELRGCPTGKGRNNSAKCQAARHETYHT
jgi:hypothetical protein